MLTVRQTRFEFSVEGPESFQLRRKQLRSTQPAKHGQPLRAALEASRSYACVQSSDQLQECEPTFTEH